MQKKIIPLSALTLSIVLASGCTTFSDKPSTVIQTTDTETVMMSNYPTRDRVEYVFNCIAKHGGKLDYVTQYACGCKIDKIAEKLTFAEYEAAATFTMLRSTPGENGAVFRDPKHSKDLRTRLKEAEAYAEENCFVK
ncbi:hypothetical protein [Methyloprofundus sp.]|uniref:hypothetical protein n=1 Tax=Methyloprofundus sp. TaxID=2020875 RepID=UPI003D14A64A